MSVVQSADKITNPAEPVEEDPLRTKPKHIRSRGGCDRCRHRRQKCDEQRPACRRCRATGLEECTYTVNLQWGGRSFKSYAGNSDIKKYETAPGTFVYVSSSKPKTSPGRTASLSRSLSPLDSTPPSTQLLLHHFATSASRITSCHPEIQSAFCSLLIPMATSYPPLLSALMALSAIHRHSLFTPQAPSLPPTSSQAHATHHPPQSKEIMTLKASSVAQLRTDLLLTSNQMRDAVLATALTLCMCEIHSGADQPRSWRLHLEGARAILSSSPALPSTSLSDPKSQTGLLERWYTSIEALAAFTSKGLPAGQLPDTASSTEEEIKCEKEEQEEEVGYLDDYFGFSTDLVEVFKEIGALVWERRALLSAEHSAHALLTEEDITTEAHILESRIQGMIVEGGITPVRFLPGVRETLSEEIVKEFYLCNTAYHYTALLHLYRRVMLLDRSDARIQTCVARILECVEGIQPREGLSPYIVLTMPLFTAGRDALGECRERVRTMMRELGEKLGLRNVWRSLEFLEEGWAGGVEMEVDENDCDFLPY